MTHLNFMCSCCPAPACPPTFTEYLVHAKCYPGHEKARRPACAGVEERARVQGVSVAAGRCGVSGGGTGGAVVGGVEGRVGPARPGGSGSGGVEERKSTVLWATGSGNTGRMWRLR